MRGRPARAGRQTRRQTRRQRRAGARGEGATEQMWRRSTRVAVASTLSPALDGALQSVLFFAGLWQAERMPLTKALDMTREAVDHMDERASRWEL